MSIAGDCPDYPSVVIGSDELDMSVSLSFPDPELNVSRRSLMGSFVLNVFGHIEVARSAS